MARAPARLEHTCKSRIYKLDRVPLPAWSTLATKNLYVDICLLDKVQHLAQHLASIHHLQPEAWPRLLLPLCHILSHPGPACALPDATAWETVTPAAHTLARHLKENGNMSMLVLARAATALLVAGRAGRTLGDQAVL